MTGTESDMWAGHTENRPVPVSGRSIGAFLSDLQSFLLPQNGKYSLVRLLVQHSVYAMESTFSFYSGIFLLSLYGTYIPQSQLMEFIQEFWV